VGTVSTSPFVLSGVYFGVNLRSSDIGGSDGPALPELRLDAVLTWVASFGGFVGSSVAMIVLSSARDCP